MKTQIPRHIVSVALLFLILAGITAQTAAAEVRVTIGAGTPLKGIEAQNVSDHMLTVMHELAKARNDLEDKQTTQARQELINAKDALYAIENSHGDGLASLNISTTHQAGNLGIDDAVQELNMKSLRQLDQAKAALKRGDFAKAESIVDAVDYPLVYAEIDIPIRQTSASVAQVIKLIDKKQLENADAALETIQFNIETDAGLFAGDF
jgi:hypothetical protein